MDDLEIIERRFQELIAEGDRLRPRHPDDPRTKYSSELHQWLVASDHLIQTVTIGNGTYAKASESLLDEGAFLKHYPSTLAHQRLAKMLGILKSTYEDWADGLLRKIEFIVAAETFDQFLDKAEVYHKGGKKTESGVLVSAVFEDTLKKVALRKGLSPAGLASQVIIDALRDDGHITPVYAKRLEEAATLRNRALHAEWDEFEIRDVGSVIKTVRDLIREHLDR